MYVAVFKPYKNVSKLKKKISTENKSKKDHRGTRNAYEHILLKFPFI